MSTMNASFIEENISNNATQHDYDCEYETLDTTTADIIWKTFPPVLIILGTIGNILILTVLVNISMHKRTTGVFLCALAVSDILGLYIGLFLKWIESLTGLKVKSTDDIACKVIPWLTYSVLDYSAWIVVAVTVERVVATTYPLGSKDICTLRLTKVYLISSGMLLLAINSHMLYGFEYIEYTNPCNVTYVHCQPTSESYWRFFSKTWPWIDVTVYCLLPFIVIIAGNIVIMTKVRRSHGKSVRSRSLSETSSRSISLSRGKKRISTLTVTMLLINTAFLISTFPVSLYFLIELLSVDYFRDQKNQASYELWWAIVYNFMFVNNTFNVCLYCLSGARFRQGVLALYRRIRSFCTGSLSMSSYGARSYPNSQDKSVSSTVDEPEAVSTYDEADNSCGATNKQVEMPLK